MYEEIFESIRVAAAKRNLKESTAGAYCRTVKYFMDTIGKVSLAELTMEDAESFLMEKQLSGVRPKTYNHYHSAIKFLYRRLLKALWDDDVLSVRTKAKELALCRNLLGCRKYLSELRGMKSTEVLKHLWGIDVCSCRSCGGRLVASAPKYPLRI